MVQANKVVDEAYATTWGLNPDGLVIASLCRHYAIAEMARDEAERKLAGAQMQIGRLKKQIEGAKDED